MKLNQTISAVIVIAFAALLSLTASASSSASPIDSFNINSIEDTAPTCVSYDFNGDGFIDLDDINTVLFNSIFADAPYDPRYDLIPDGVVDIADIFAVAVHFGETCPLMSQ